jgi:hypothetical protein
VDNVGVTEGEAYTTYYQKVAFLPFQKNEVLEMVLEPENI